MKKGTKLTLFIGLITAIAAVAASVTDAVSGAQTGRGGAGALSGLLHSVSSAPDSAESLGTPALLCPVPPVSYRRKR